MFRPLVASCVICWPDIRVLTSFELDLKGVRLNDHLLSRRANRAGNIFPKCFGDIQNNPVFPVGREARGAGCKVVVTIIHLTQSNLTTSSFA